MCDTNDDNGGIYFGETVTEQLTPNFTDLDMKLDYTLVPTTLGDAIFFDSYVPHASYDNRTEDPRPFLFFTHQNVRVIFMNSIMRTNLKMFPLIFTKKKASLTDLETVMWKKVF